MAGLQSTWQRVRRALSQRVKTPALRSIARTFAHDPRYHYACFHTTDTAAALLFRNALKPKRIFTKGLYGQLPVVPKVFGAPRPPATATEARGSVADTARRFREDGIVIIPGLFAKEVAALRERYEIDRFRESRNCYAGRRFDPRREASMGAIVTDRLVLSVFAEHFGCQPFLQHLPGLVVTMPDFSDADYQRSLRSMDRGGAYLGNKNANLNWHYDTVNQVSIHVHVSDVDTRTSHMLYARTSHLRHHNYLHHDYDYYYSDEYVRSHYEIVPCVGPAGTAVLFDSNGLHRLYPVSRGYRCLVIVDWSPGNDCAYFPINEEGIASRPGAAPTAALNELTLDELQRASLSKLPASLTPG